MSNGPLSAVNIPISEYDNTAPIPYSARTSWDIIEQEQSTIEPWIREGRAFNPSIYKDTVHIWQGRGINTQALYGPYHVDDKRGIERKQPVLRLGKDGYNTTAIANSTTAQIAHHKAGDKITYGLILNTMPSPVCVIDLDDPSKFYDVLERFGETPLIFETLGGYHFYYYNPDRLNTVTQNQCIEAIDFKASGMVAAPFSSTNRLGARVEWRERPKELSDLEALERIADIIANGELPPLHRQAMGHFYPDVFDESGALRGSTVTKIIRPQDGFDNQDNSPPAKANSNYEAHPSHKVRRQGAINMGRSPKGQRSNDLFKVACFRLAPMPRSESSLQQITTLLADHNLRNMEPPLSDSDVKKTAKSAFKNHISGKNYSEGIGGPKQRGQAYDIPDDIRDRIIKAIGSRNAKAVTDKNVIPLFKDLLAKNDLNGHFTLHKAYLTEVISRTGSKMLARYKEALKGAGLIEAVPLEELGVKTRYAFNRKDEQGKAIKGRAEMFRFTALTKSMAGESVSVECRIGEIERKIKSFRYKDSKAFLTHNKLEKQKDTLRRSNDKFLREHSIDWRSKTDAQKAQSGKSLNAAMTTPRRQVVSLKTAESNKVSAGDNLAMVLKKLEQSVSARGP